MCALPPSSLRSNLLSADDALLGMNITSSLAYCLLGPVVSQHKGQQPHRIRQDVPSLERKGGRESTAPRTCAEETASAGASLC